MENAPLTLAHNHARNALLETRRSNPVAASEEHDLAAAEFASAAHGTSDSEAVRILTLLEQHHKKLGQILKSNHEKPPKERPLSPESQYPPGPARPFHTKAIKHVDDLPATPQADSGQQPPRLPHTSRLQGRDMSSSIASNLATARGIPGSHQRRAAPVSPTLSAQHVGGKFARDVTSSRPMEGTKEDTPSPALKEQGSRSTEDHEKPPHIDLSTDPKVSKSDAPFQHFYATFESLISKLSAPLAFASLPLTTASASKPSPADPNQNTKHPTPPQPTTLEAIESSQLISRAALRAVRSSHHSPFPTTFNPAESFYLVPTAGGMASYADIMKRAERDAREAAGGRPQPQPPIPPSIMGPPPAPHSSTSSTSAARSSLTLRPREPTVSGKTMEELSLENATLRSYLDATAKRLRLFELSAQSSSAALAQSIRDLQRAGSPLGTPENSRGSTAPNDSSKKTGDEEARKRIAELEEIVRRSDKELARRERENAKLRDVVGRYREKWERLKEGARARRGDGDGGGGKIRGEDRPGTGTETPKKGDAEDAE